MAPDVERLERLLARDARHYLDTRELSMGGALERLLSWHGHHRGLWRHGWFDGVDIPVINADGRSAIEILGVAIYGDRGTSEQWVEASGATLRLAEGGDLLEDYTLRFGRKGFEDERLPYEDMGRLVKQLVGGVRWKWAYDFTREDARG